MIFAARDAMVLFLVELRLKSKGMRRIEKIGGVLREGRKD